MGNNEGEKAALGTVEAGVLVALLILLDAESYGRGAWSCREATARMRKQSSDMTWRGSDEEVNSRRGRGLTDPDGGGARLQRNSRTEETVARTELGAARCCGT